MKSALAVLTAAFTGLSFAAASADTSPVVNRVIIQQSVQQQMNNQLQTESLQLQMQQQQSQATLAQQMQQQFVLQQLQMQQNQMTLIELRALLNARSSKSHKRSPHSR